MTKIDCLIEVAQKLREARALGERSSDRALLYFIDMTIAHVCDSLDARSGTKGAEDNQARAIKAAREQSEAFRPQPKSDVHRPLSSQRFGVRDQRSLIVGALANLRANR